MTFNGKLGSDILKIDINLVSGVLAIIAGAYIVYTGNMTGGIFLVVLGGFFIARPWILQHARS